MIMLARSVIMWMISLVWLHIFLEIETCYHAIHVYTKTYRVKPSITIVSLSHKDSRVTFGASQIALVECG